MLMVEDVWGSAAWNEFKVKETKEEKTIRNE